MSTPETANAEHEALTDALDDVATYANYAESNYHDTGISPEASAINNLIDAVRSLRVAADNMGERIKRLEGGR